MYTQYDFVRRLASAFTYHFEASKKSAKDTWVLKNEKGNSFFTQCPTRLDFFIVSKSYCDPEWVER